MSPAPSTPRRWTPRSRRARPGGGPSGHPIWPGSRRCPLRAGGRVSGQSRGPPAPGRGARHCVAPSRHGRAGRRRQHGQPQRFGVEAELLRQLLRVERAGRRTERRRAAPLLETRVAAERRVQGEAASGRVGRSSCAISGFSRASVVTLQQRSQLRRQSCAGLRQRRRSYAGVGASARGADRRSEAAAPTPARRKRS